LLKTMAAGAVSTAVAPTRAAGEDARQPPNVVLIVVDDLGYGDLSCYGATDLQTPHIDGLAASGVRFTQFYANCPVCSPTRASVLTGRYPDLVGVPGVIRTHRENSWGYLDPKAVLLPRVLARAGYHTAIVGKWHLGLGSPNTPNEHGFDYFHGFLGDMMDDYYSHLRHDINYMRLNDQTIEPEGHATDLFSQWAADYVEERAATAQPFFLYLAYNAPHTPIQPPEAWLERVRQRHPDMAPKRAQLVALIEHMDDGIGRVMAALEACGAADNTLVVFVSDNGGQSNVGAQNGPLRGGKQDLYEGGIRVPMCAAWPGHIPGGGRSDRVALTMDLYPTICEACGAATDAEMDGSSMLPALRGEEQPEEDRYLFWVRREGGRHGGRAYRAVRHGDHKLVQNSPFEPYELFDLGEDPLEEHPLPRSHKAYRRLFSALREHVNRSGAVPWQPPDAPAETTEG